MEFPLRILKIIELKCGLCTVADIEAHDLSALWIWPAGVTGPMLNLDAHMLKCLWILHCRY